VHPGGTTPDGLFTLEDAECLALCGNAPCVTVNWRFFGNMTPERWDALIEDLRAGRLDAEVPPHGTLCRVQRSVGLPAAAPEPPSPGKAGRAVKKAAPAAATGATDAVGQPVALGTTRTTPAVASTLLVGGPPTTEETGR
jgi:NADH-quinone oxidoreductase subunit E